jgi:hypothetical protein
MKPTRTPNTGTRRRRPAVIAPAQASPGMVNNLPARTGGNKLRTKPAATERTPAVALAHAPLVPAHHLNREVADFAFVPSEQVKTLRHHLENHLGAELRRGGRVLAIAGAIVLGWAGPCAAFGSGHRERQPCRPL